MKKSLQLVVVLLALTGAVMGAVALWTVTRPTVPSPDTPASVSQVEQPDPADDRPGQAAISHKRLMQLALRSEAMEGNTQIRLKINRGDGRSIRDGWSGDATFESAVGVATYDPHKRELLGLELTIDSDSVVGYGIREPMNADSIQRNLRSLFGDDHRPTISFRATSIRPAQEDDPDLRYRRDWHHRVAGELIVGDRVILLDAPARIEISERGLYFQFYHRVEREAVMPEAAQQDGVPVPPETLRSYIWIGLEIGGRGALQTLQDQVQDATASNRGLINRWMYEHERLTSRVEWLQIAYLTSLDRNRALSLERVKPVSATLPPGFTETVRFVPRRDHQFEMVLVPGDPSRGIDPFYMSTTEVSWKNFMAWAENRDLANDERPGRAVLGVRPDMPFGGDWGPQYPDSERQPAHQLSFRNAAAYCHMLSERTGRVYRLPTHAEWEHALRLGGGLPETTDAKLKIARLRENMQVREDPFDPFYVPGEELDLSNPDVFNSVARMSDVGSLAPDALGLYDMLGSVAEWVWSEKRFEYIAVGGHFRLPADELGNDWHLKEKLDAWNITWPDRPVSRFWYRDCDVTGFRLVCEPVNVPGGE